MIVIERIDSIRKKRGWSINKLATESMLTQSTIASMYARKTPPKIEVLQMICEAFNITLAEFFSENEMFDLSESEINLINLYRALPKEKRDAIACLLSK